MARLPDVARRRFISGTPLDTLILVSFNSGVFNLFYTIAPFRKVWVQIDPTKLSRSLSYYFHVRGATVTY